MGFSVVGSFLRIIYWLAFTGQFATEFILQNILTLFLYSYYGHLGNLFPSSVLSCTWLRKLEIKDNVKTLQVKKIWTLLWGAFSHHLTSYVRGNIALFMYHIFFCLHNWFPIFRRVTRNRIYLRIVHGRDCWIFFLLLEFFESSLLFTKPVGYT